MHRFLFPMNYLYRNIFDSCLGGCNYFLFLYIFFFYIAKAFSSMTCVMTALKKRGGGGEGWRRGFFPACHRKYEIPACRQK